MYLFLMSLLGGGGRGSKQIKPMSLYILFFWWLPLGIGMVGWLRRVLKVHTFEIHFKHLKSLFVFHQVKGVYLRLLNISKGLFLPFYKIFYLLSLHCHFIVENKWKKQDSLFLSWFPTKQPQAAIKHAPNIEDRRNEIETWNIKCIL